MFLSKNKLLISACFILLVQCVPGWACYSGLLIIPSAEVVEADSYSFEFQVDGNLSTPKAETYLLNTEFGFADRFEAGVDFDLSDDADTRLLLNGKYIIGMTTDRGALS